MKDLQSAIFAFLRTTEQERCRGKWPFANGALGKRAATHPSQRTLWANE